jgi:hypothetical protein
MSRAGTASIAHGPGTEAGHRPESCHVPATTGSGNVVGTTRRLQALASRRWNAASLAPQLPGMDVRRINRVMHGIYTRVSDGEAAAVAELYDRIWSIDGPGDGPCQHARNWPVPMAWDDHRGDEHWIDDPDAKPYPGWQRPTKARRADLPGFIADVNELLARHDPNEPDGWLSRRTVADRLGITGDCLEQRITRARQAGIWVWGDPIPEPTEDAGKEAAVSIEQLAGVAS